MEFDAVYEYLTGGVEPFSPALWHQAREECYQRIHHAAMTSPSQAKHLIIVDDNMYLRSMRRRCFRIARECGAAFQIIHCRASLELSLRHNAMRSSGQKVNEESIRHMAISFEEPNSESHKWEGPILIMDSSLELDVDQVMKSIVENWGQAPMKQIEETSDGQRSHESAIHSLDVLTRRIVSLAVEGAPEGVAKGNLARLLNQERRKVLTRARELHMSSSTDAELFVDELRASWELLLRKF